ncbi:S-norcoclaurine synthase 1-like [Panicum miliaceum]|uniref:S-norcoclaurine synthase 1-like n=1 Tax=Panicum miliaceum TaxID=4540 RepID=A0A3L6S6U6_PANMI|nr:S-norcoclaurine synthase 1-like [Panicum miliaceum]
MEPADYNRPISRDNVTDAAATAFPDSVEIPERFIRTGDEARAGVVAGEDEAYELPVVDMASLLDPELSASETAKLGSACRDWGFFQLTNHGVDEAVIQRMKASTAQFFSLPLESKNAVAVREGGFEGFGHHFNAPASDKLDWAECLLLDTQPVENRNMEFWPTNPPAFRHALYRYSEEMASLARRLLGFMAADLGVGPEALLGAFGGRRQGAGVHRCPPCRRPEQVLGMRPHTDGFGLTLLLHADSTPGLQVRRHGRWFPVRPLPGALVVNVGDVLEVLSNGAYGSAEAQGDPPRREEPDHRRGVPGRVL